MTSNKWNKPTNPLYPVHTVKKNAKFSDNLYPVRIFFFSYKSSYFSEKICLSVDEKPNHIGEDKA